MASVTVHIGGVGNVQVPDSFLKLSPDEQNQQIEEIAAQATGGHAASSAAPSGPIDLNENDVWNALINHESSNRAGVLGPMTKYGRAEGLAQTLPSTAKAMAEKLGLEWKPELLTGTSKEARDYQNLVGRAYFDQGLKLYNGDVRKALRYYNGGPNGPNEAETAPYAESIIQAALGHPQLDAGNAVTPNPAPQSPSDVQTADAPPMDNPVTDGPALPHFSDQQKAAIMAYLPKAKSGADLTSFVQKLTGQSATKIGNADQVVNYIQKGGDPAKLAWAAPELEQSPPQPSPDLSPGHVGAVVSRGAAQGLMDLPEGVLSQLPSVFGGGVGMGAPIGSLLAKIPQDAFNAIVGNFGKPQTTLDRYLGAGAEGATGAVAGGQGLEDSAMNLLKAGLGAGVGGQAASDLGLPPWLGQLVGGAFGHPTIRAEGTQFIPGTKANFVKNVVNNPLGPNLVEVARDYKTLADQVHPKGAAPSGRQPLSVEEINAVGDRGLKGLRDKISKSDIPDDQKFMLRDALDHAVEIPLQRTPNMGPEQIALSDLPDTVEGRAVKAAITRAKAGDMLSARYGGEKIGSLGKLYNAGLHSLPTILGLAGGGAEGGIAGAVAGRILSPLLDRFSVKGGDINKSRMDAAAKAIKRLSLYEKAGQKLGPSGFGPALAALNDKLVGAAQDRAVADQSNDLISRRIERNIVTPTEGYRGLIYQNTGVTQPVQDQALLRMVKTGEITDKDLTRIMSDPRSLMRGKSTAGLKIMDRIGQLADQGVIPRDPAWKGPPAPEQMPQGVLNWLDAQGDPIRSNPAYFGKVIERAIKGESLDHEPPKPPKKAKAKSKKKKPQGA